MQDKRNIIKFIVVIFCIFFLANCVFATAFDQSQFSYFSSKAGFSKNASVGSVAATIIKAFLGLLGLIFVILIIYAGFNWMTARGDEQQVTKAKGTIQRAIVGVVLTLAAYIITYFVFSSLPFNAPTAPAEEPLVNQWMESFRKWIFE